LEGASPPPDPLAGSFFRAPTRVVGIDLGVALSARKDPKRLLDRADE
jgi:hypothetical protein